ncbi:hypothetical protein [Micromonospora taraxaci]
MQWYLLLAGLGLATGITVLIFKRSRDIFRRGRAVPDRHSAAIAENAALGDAANFDTGGGGGGTD